MSELDNFDDFIEDERDGHLADDPQNDADFTPTPSKRKHEI